MSTTTIYRNPGTASGPVRITSAATWTKVAEAVSADLLVRVDIVNWTANTNTVLVCIKTSVPSADTEAYATLVLNKKPTAATDSGDTATDSKVLLAAGEALYVKSDQTDTRVVVTGISQVG